MTAADRRTAPFRLRTPWEVAAIVLITLLAAALRFYRLTEVPPGLHFDEGFKGVTARALLEGAPPQLFFESDMGEEPIAIYLVAAALSLLGQEPWVVRLPSALVGTLTVPLAWWLGRELLSGYRPPHRRQQTLATPAAHEQPGDGSSEEASRLQAQIVGLSTALVLAILYWHVTFSRIGMEPILVPFFATLAFAALARGLNTGRWPVFALAGLAIGGSLYTYKAGYFVPALAALFVAYAALVERGWLRRHSRGLLLAGGIALVVAAPITVFFVSHPANFLLRPASVALGAGQTGTVDPGQALAGNVPRVLGMFFLEGDSNPRSNLPGRPALDPFLAVLFAVGLGWAAVWSVRRWVRPALPLIWLAVMVLPTLVTEYAPHFGRAIGVTPALALLCALGLWALWRAAARLRRRWATGIALAALALGFSFSAASTARTYFVTWGQSADLFYAYDVGLVQVARFLNARPASDQLYLTPTPRDHYTLQFLVWRPLASFDGRHGLVLPPPGQAATIIVLLREDGTTLPALQQLRPDGQVVWTLADAAGRPYAAAYALPATPAGSTPIPAPDHPVGVTFGQAIRLLGYSLEKDQAAPGETLPLVLYWQAVTPMDQDYTVFAHLLGEHNPATGGPLWAGHDGQPVGGQYPTAVWQPGQVILDHHPLAIPAGTPPGTYQLEAGLYLLSSLARLPAVDASGQRLPGDAALLGTVQVED